MDDVELVILDFDLTLLNIHACAERVSAREVETGGRDGDFVDVECFRAFVGSAKTRGIDVRIASFGVYEVIQAYVDRALGKGAMTRREISTPSVVGVRDGCSVSGGKNKQMQKFCEEKYGEKEWKRYANRVLLFDDDERNVAKAIEGGFRAVRVPAGFTKDVARLLFPSDF
ncbi:HAD-like domain [Ostreococcus tauri]|uniref:HAD-like domain n=1 Tax=Ostreococcus tauri TaxID=70448 RepID=A0A090M7A0_OSTTA|nr:HAD-like domain [Ostreococcus tauri]CEF98567.1 HAD-like domain [Ostreococcus tauri]|eukprot:XP_022839340.1 HAD-like domain [Ostreococcus tauri]